MDPLCGRLRPILRVNPRRGETKGSAAPTGRCPPQSGVVNIKKVIYYSPKHKLKCYIFEEGDEPLKKIRAKPNTYAYRKNLSKQHCERMINRNQSKEMIEFYKNLKTKKDDASDAFLQAVAYQNGY